jgi:sugar lactone lactonase YvrE
MRKNKTVKLLIIALLGLSIIPIAIHPAKAAVAAPGFAVTNFATGFVSSTQFCSGSPGCGPLGVAFDVSGNLFVVDIQNGFLYKFGPGGGVAGPSTQVNTVPIPGVPAGLAFSKDGRLYSTRPLAGDVVELSTSTGTVVRTIASVPPSNGIATDPLSGDLFISASGTIMRISNFASGPGSVTSYTPIVSDGLAFGPDGTLYAASGTCGGVAKVAGTNSATPGSFTCVASVPSIDGMAVSANPSTPFLFGNRNDGIITKVDLSTSPPTLTNVVTAGTRGDFATVGSDGCLYATQTDSVLKVTNADGSCIPPPLGPLFPSNPSPPPCVTPASGLVSWWPLEGNANDIVDGNTGTVVGTGGQFVPGEVGLGFQSGGPGSLVQVNDAPNLTPAQFTLDVWVKINAINSGTDNMPIIWKGNNLGQSVTDTYGLVVFSNPGSRALPPGSIISGTPASGKAFFEIDNGTFSQVLVSNDPIPIGTFVHFTASADGSTMRLFINGILDNQASQVMKPQHSLFPFQIGSSPATTFPGFFFNGVIDEVKLYNLAGGCNPTLHVSKFFTDSSLSHLQLDQHGNPSVNVTLSHGTVVSTNPGQVLAWVNVTNTSGSRVQSLKLNDTLPVDWKVDPAWMPALGAIHVFFANTTSLLTNPEITQPSTITVSTGNPEVVHLAIANLTATNIGHPLMPGQSILLSVKLTYGLIGTSQSASSYPRNYTDTALAAAWTKASFMGTESTGSGSAFFTADAKVVS